MQEAVDVYVVCLYPLCALPLEGGVQECYIYIIGVGFCVFVYSVGFPKTSNANKYGYRFPRFSFYYANLNLLMNRPVLGSLLETKQRKDE